MAVDTSRAPMELPSRNWDGREHMIESLAKLEGKTGDPFYVARQPLMHQPQKRGLYADVESPRSVVNVLMSPGLESASPAADAITAEAPEWSRGSHSVSPGSVGALGEVSADESSKATGAAGAGSLPPDLSGQQLAVDSNQTQVGGQFGNSGRDTQGSGGNAQKAADRDGNPSNWSGGSQGGAAGGDRNNDDGARKNQDGVPGAAEQRELARQRELAFEGNQQRPEPRKEAPVKQDFFTKIKLAMCASAQPIESDMEDRREFRIGWPTNVKHLVHVSFDRFRGFVGLPEEMGAEQKNAPGASLSVFGVKPESLQVTWDRNHKHCVPTVLFQLHERLLQENGLRVEGVFRIAAESEEEEYIRSKLNKGEEPPQTEVHVLAGLIKAWFRELPTGVLDTLTPEQVAAAQKESEVVALVKQLPDTNYALLDWAVDLMADVVEQQSYNKMNARNIAMVFAPNMTQVMDPLKALMHAVKVMNLLKVLIEKRLRERRQAAAEEAARVEREMLRLAEEEEARVRAEEEAVERALKEREERDAAVLAEQEASLAGAGEGVNAPEEGVHADEEMEMRSSALVDGTASWQSLAASVAALLAGGGAQAADRAAGRADGGDSEDEFFESSDSIKAPAGAADVRSPEGSALGAGSAEVDAPVQTPGADVAQEAVRLDGEEEAEGGDVATGEVLATAEVRVEGGEEVDDVATEDGVAEAMSLPVTRSELLVLVGELERKDELLPVPEEENSAEPAVVREKVDIALESDDVPEDEEILPAGEPQREVEVVEMSNAAKYYKQT